MKIFSKLDNSRHYGSMTHSRYALETLELALDDTYDTNNVLLEQYQFAEAYCGKKKKTKKSKKTVAKARIKKKVLNADLCPF